MNLTQMAIISTTVPSAQGFFWGIESQHVPVTPGKCFLQQMCACGDSHVRCPGPTVTQAEKHQGSREVKVKVKEQGAGGVCPGLAEVEGAAP